LLERGFLCVIGLAPYAGIDRIRSGVEARASSQLYSSPGVSRIIAPNFARVNPLGAEYLPLASALRIFSSVLFVPFCAFYIYTRPDWI